MNLIPTALSLLASILVLALLAVHLRRRRTRQGGFVEIAPGYRGYFRRLGLTRAEHFLALPGANPHIVSGHPDRHVVRIPLHSDAACWIAFLKREHRVTWGTRLANALAGFGLSSRCVREARTLQRLQREDIRGPEWLAAGEDGQGRAFLLVREVAGVELRAFLQTEDDRARRRSIARSIGTLLGRLHRAGFRHPDLYANHFFVSRSDGAIHILDWQRSQLTRTLAWQERQRDLAALHATLDDSLATPRERLICLRAYRQAGGDPGIAAPPVIRGIEVQARYLLGRRHIREKRQLPAAQPQAWLSLEDGSLCITPTMRARCTDQVPHWLRTQQETRTPAETPTRLWPTLPDGSRVLLVRRRSWQSLARLWQRLLRPTSFASPEQRQAALLLRLQRHGIAVPQVLALGQRRVGGHVESLLLTEPIADTTSLEAWLACQNRRRATPAGQARRWAVLRQAGAVLHSLHAASCYLELGPAGCGLAVQQVGTAIHVVLDRAETVKPCRRRQPGRAARDVTRLQQILHAAGCSRSDLCRFRAGYQQAESNEHPAGGSRLAPHDVQAMATVLSGTRRPLVHLLPPAGESASLARRLLRGIRRLYQRPDWPLFAGADWVDHILDVAVTDRFHAKQGRSTGRWILHAPKEHGAGSRRLSVYLKRHYHLPWWDGLLAALWPGRGWSPAVCELQHLEWARQQGLPVPEVAAAAEYIGPWGRLRSFLAVEELAGMLPLHEAIPLAAIRQDAGAFRQWKRSLVAEMARLARMLHDRRCFHKDLYLCHFYIARADTLTEPAQGWRGRVYLIDLHRLAHHPRTWRIWQTKDLAQLLYSSEIVGVDARDRLSFWRAYRGTESQRGEGWLRRLVLFKWRRYRRHNTRNQQRRQDAQRAA